MEAINKEMYTVANEGVLFIMIVIKVFEKAQEFLILITEMKMIIYLLIENTILRQ